VAPRKRRCLRARPIRLVPRHLVLLDSRRRRLPTLIRFRRALGEKMRVVGDASFWAFLSVFPSFSAAAVWIWLVVVVAGAVQVVRGGMHIRRRCRQR
jgi:hypothetical protein